MGRVSARSGSPFEDIIGFSRAVRVGDRVIVSGTAPVWPDGHVEVDVERQTVRCIEIIAASLEQLGSGLEEVVRTRMFLVNSGDAEAVGRAHAVAFGRCRPAATMVIVAALLDARWRVEIEAEAIIGSAPEQGAP